MPCLTCGKPIGSAKGYCPQHAQQQAARAERSRQRPTPTQRGYDSQWQRLSKRILASSPSCFWCGRPADTVDHLIPMSIDPSLRLDPANLVPACRKCNSGRKPKKAS